MAAIKGNKTVATVNSDSAPAHMSGHVLLASFQQAQDHQMLAEVSGGTVQYLRGPVDMVKWRELHIIFDAAKAALVLSDLAPSPLLRCEPFLFKSESGWNPGLELWGDTSHSHVFDFPKIKTVVEVVLAGLKRDAANDAEDMAALELQGIERAAVRQIIAETLGASGGKKLAEPVHVTVEHSTLKVEGKLGSKPSQANFHPLEEKLSGRFSGFDLDKRELLFSTASKRIFLNFERLQVDVLEVARACLEGRDCEVRTQKTTARDGRENRAYLPEAPFRL